MDRLVTQSITYGLWIRFSLAGSLFFSEMCTLCKDTIIRVVSKIKFVILNASCTLFSSVQSTDSEDVQWFFIMQMVKPMGVTGSYV